MTTISTNDVAYDSTDELPETASLSAAPGHMFACMYNITRRNITIESTNLKLVKILPDVQVMVNTIGEQIVCGASGLPRTLSARSVSIMLRIFNLRVSNPNKLIVDVFFDTMSDFNVPGSRPNKNTMKFRKSTARGKTGAANLRPICYVYTYMYTHVYIHMYIYNYVYIILWISEGLTQA